MTGGSGYIGRHLVPELLAAGHSLTLLLRDPGTLLGAHWYSRVKVVKGALQDEDAVREACEGQEGLIHLAALAHITHSQPEDHWREGLGATESLLAVARAVPSLRYLLFMSSIKASDAAGTSAYGQAKLAAEQAVIAAAQANGWRWNVLRPGVVYGPGMKGNLAAWIRRSQGGWLPPLPADTASVSMISAQGLCRMVKQIVEGPQYQDAIYLAVEPEPYSLKALEGAIYRAQGRSARRWVLPRPFWWLAGRLGDALEGIGLSLGFSSRSYATLFLDEKPAPGAVALPPALVPAPAFEQTLPLLLRQQD